MRVKCVSAAQAREHHEAELASIDEAIAAVDAQLSYRGEVSDEMPKVESNVRPPKLKK